MSVNYFRVLGGLTLLLGPGMLAATLTSPPGWTQLLRWLFLVLAVEVAGFGLAFLRKGAALFVSVPLSCFGIHSAFVSIYQIAFPLNLLAMFHGLSLTLSLVLTIRLWKQLTWGGRFF